MIDFVNTEFLSCVAAGFVAGAGVAGAIMGIRAVVRVMLRLIRKA